jgi:CHASE2 domain-containing sensor protein
MAKSGFTTAASRVVPEVVRLHSPPPLSILVEYKFLPSFASAEQRNHPLGDARPKAVPRSGTAQPSQHSSAIPNRAEVVAASQIRSELRRQRQSGLSPYAGVASRPRGHWRPKDKHVVLVFIQEPDRLMRNVCEERVLIADLLETLAKDYGARVIVLDEVFSPTSCPEPQTQSLRNAVTQLTQASQRPTELVYGRDTESAGDLGRDKLKELTNNGFKDDDNLILLKTALPQNPRLNWGLVVRIVINRRIPLGWRCYDDEATVDAQPKLQDTLPVAAVKAAADAKVFEVPFLSDLSRRQGKGEDPFTSFLPANQPPFEGSDASAKHSPHGFATFSALELLCEGSQNVDWECPKTWSKRKRRPSTVFDGRLIVVGTVDREFDPDIQDSVIGRVPGVVLQANYIESLLDGRYLKRVNSGIELVIALVWLWVIDKIFEENSSRPGRALLYSIGANVLVWVLLYDLLLLTIGYYVSLSVPSFLMIVGRFIWTLEMKRHGSEELQAGAGG